VQLGVDFFARTRGISRLSSNAVIFMILNEMRSLDPELKSIRPLPDAVLRGSPKRRG
jgi:hypothetical protein